MDEIETWRREISHSDPKQSNEKCNRFWETASELWRESRIISANLKKPRRNCYQVLMRLRERQKKKAIKNPSESRGNLEPILKWEWKILNNEWQLGRIQRNTGTSGWKVNLESIFGQQPPESMQREAQIVGRRRHRRAKSQEESRVQTQVKTTAVESTRNGC